MSYTNGLGNLQQVFSTADAAAAAKTSAAEKPELNHPHLSSNLPADSATSADQTNLSAASGIMAQALNGSDVRSEKVAVLQQSIAAGTYNVSASDVASRLIESLLNKG